MSDETLPLFPLGVVLFPQAPLPLYIFEERYKEMLSYCIENEEPFGVVYLDSGKVFSIGTTSHVVNVLHVWDDGRMHLHCEGRRRFRVNRFIQEKAYLQGEVEYFEDEEEQTDQTLHDKLMDFFKVYVALKRKDKDHLPVKSDDEDLDPETINEAIDKIVEDAESSETPSLRVLPFVGIEPRKKQDFLEMTSENARAERLNHILQESILAIQRLYRIKGLLGTNGHCPPEGGEWEFFKDADYL